VFDVFRWTISGRPVGLPGEGVEMKGFLLGLAAGYVLGTRAGKKRYEEIVSIWQTLVDHPAVQGVAGVVRAKVSEVTGSGTSEERRSTSEGKNRRLPGTPSQSGYGSESGLPAPSHGERMTERGSGSSVGPRGAGRP
jgi:hypothetical protein